MSDNVEVKVNCHSKITVNPKIIINGQEVDASKYTDRNGNITIDNSNTNIIINGQRVTSEKMLQETHSLPRKAHKAAEHHSAKTTVTPGQPGDNQLIGDNQMLSIKTNEGVLHGFLTTIHGCHSRQFQGSITDGTGISTYSFTLPEGCRTQKQIRDSVLSQINNSQRTNEIDEGW